MFKIIIMKKIIIVLVSIIALALIGLYFYTYKSHRDISTEEADFTFNSSQLQSDFDANDSLFNAKYADKTMEIYGKITAIDLQNNAIMLDEKIAVTFTDSISDNSKISDSIYIKGRYVGFDDLLEEFKIDQAIIIKK